MPEDKDLIVKKNEDIIKEEPEQVIYKELLENAGELNLTEKQKKALYAPVDEKYVEIREDGLIYLPWIFYHKRLTEAFGLNWALIPLSPPLIKNNFVYREYALKVQGSIMAVSVGEQEYFEDNRRMSYGDALEGAKSNALMRCCKELGISLELWDKNFINSWLKKYAYQKEYRGRTRWYKKREGQEPAPKFKSEKDIVKEILVTKSKIKEILDNKDFTGQINYKGKFINLDEAKQETLERLDNYNLEQLKKILARVIDILNFVLDLQPDNLVEFMDAEAEDENKLFKESEYD